MRARGLSRSTQRDYRALFRALEEFACERGVSEIGAVDEALLRQWRECWTYKVTTHQTRLNRLKAFFRFASQSGWVEESPAARLLPPKGEAPPTMPLIRSEMMALCAAAQGQPRERALLLLMRYSGLAIRDATTLAREALDGDQLTLQRAKSGELVLCALPPPVIAALDDIAVPAKRHYFWTGRSRPETVSNYWRERLRKIAEKAGVRGFHPHRLRDTFAVELLLAGVAMQDVSALLGHASITTTERHYAPWDLSRRDRLAAIVRDANERDELLKALAEDPVEETSAGAVPSSPRQRPGRDHPSEKEAERAKR